MPIVHLLHGYLGVGKTTFARQLEAELTAIRFTHDEWMRELYGDDPPADLFADYALRVSNLMKAMWTRCVSLGLDVVLDSGFWSRQERDRTRHLVASLGAEARLYRLSCDADLAWSRIQARNATYGASLFISPDTCQVLKARFEPLDDDEARIEIPPS